MRSLERIFINPLFYDSLSGEFSPTCDPEKRKHTLGRLAVATITKGSRNPSQATEYEVGYSYIPSWAAESDSIVINYRFEQGLNEELSALHLHAPEGPSLDIIRWLSDNGGTPNNELTVRYGGEHFEGNLELGSKLNSARDFITESAQQFFNQFE